MEKKLKAYHRDIGVARCQRPRSYRTLGRGGCTCRHLPSAIETEKEDVVFIGGSDEHGVPITIRAKKEGITPQDVVYCDQTLIKKSFEEFGISFDVYSRTTSKTHHDTASEFFRKLYDKGEFIEKTSMQYYDEEAKTFLADRYITGECPHCHAEGAYGDQCEKSPYKPQPYRPD